MVGGGGRIRQSIIFQTTTITSTTASVAHNIRQREGTRSSTAYSASVSIRSAKLKSSSVNPPLLWVETTSRTLL